MSHIGIPALFGFALVVFSAASSREDPTWDLAPEGGLEIAILGIGSTAAIFENPRVMGAYGPHAITVAVALVACNWVLAATIVAIKRFFFLPVTYKVLWAGITLSLGFATLFIMSFSLWYATYHSFTTMPPSPVGG